MPEVLAVSVCPTCAVPLMAGDPVAGLLELSATDAVGELVRDSSLPSSSVKVTFTLMILPKSVDTRVYVDPVAPEIAVSRFESHW